MDKRFMSTFELKLISSMSPHKEERQEAQLELERRKKEGK